MSVNFALSSSCKGRYCLAFTVVTIELEKLHNNDTVYYGRCLCFYLMIARPLILRRNFATLVSTLESKHWKLVNCFSVTRKANENGTKIIARVDLHLHRSNPVAPETIDSRFRDDKYCDSLSR